MQIKVSCTYYRAFQTNTKELNEKLQCKISQVFEFSLIVKFHQQFYEYLVRPFLVQSINLSSSVISPGLLIAVAPRYRYCSGATFTVAVAVAPLLLAESSADGSAATFLAAF